MATETGGAGQEALVADMTLALRAEIGARYLYPLLARLSRDPELSQVLSEIHRETDAQVTELGDLIAGLGGRPERSRVTRHLTAWALFAWTALIGLRLAMRLCHDSETKVARWYAGYVQWFAERGDASRARRCEVLRVAKLRHAGVLATWLQHLPR